ncbi:MAG: outer membrane receptor for ferrienterochelin and colicins, partial [Ulvibacter sp.]
MKLLLYLLLFTPCLLFSQEKVIGKIMEANENGYHVSLNGANVYWLDTSVGTITDIDGNFSLPYKEEYNKLVVSYIGYKTDT